MKQTSINIHYLNLKNLQKFRGALCTHFLFDIFKYFSTSLKFYKQTKLKKPICHFEPGLRIIFSPVAVPRHPLFSSRHPMTKLNGGNIMDKTLVTITYKAARGKQDLFDRLINRRCHFSRMLIAFFNTSSASLVSRSSRFKPAISACSSEA